MNRRIRALALGWAWVVAGLWLFRHLLNVYPEWPEFEAARANLVGASSGAIAARHLVTLRAVLVFVAFTAACRFAGMQLFAWIGLSARRRRSAAWLPALPAGWGLAGTCGFGLAACGIFRTPVLGLLVTIAACAGARGLLSVSRTALRDTGGLWGAAGPAGKMCAVLAVVLVMLQTVASLAPECGIDSLIHHLAEAARVLASGRLVPMPGNAPFHFSAVSELLRAAAMGLGGEPAARLFGPAATALTVLMLGLGVGARVGADWGWCAAALFVSAEPVIAFGIGCKPDIMLAPCGLAALRLLGRDSRWRNRPRAIAAGWMLGTAAAMKYLAGGLAVSVVVFAGAGGSPAVILAGLIMGAAAPVIPWLAKSWLLTGNPVYPAGHHYFGGLELTPATAANLMNYIATVTHHASYSSVWERLGAPWTMTLVEGAPPGWLALLPLCLLVRGRSASGWRWPAVAVGCLGLWALGPIQIRYLIPILPILAWLSAESLASLPRSGAMVVAALIIIQTGRTAGIPDLVGNVPAGLGLEDRAAFFRGRFPQYAEALEVLRTLPASSRVMGIGIDAAYPLVCPLLVSSRVQPPQTYALIRASRDPEELWRRMRQLKVTHVLYNPMAAIFLRELQAVNPWATRDLAVWEEMWRHHAREIFRSSRMSERHGWFILYSLVPRPVSRPSYGFLPGTEGVLAKVETEVLVQGLAAGMKQFLVLAPIAGHYGSFRHFHARMLRTTRPHEALTDFQAAEQSGYRAPAMQ